MKCESAICNKCSQKTSVHTFKSDVGSLFNICPDCAAIVLQHLFYDMKLPQIGDLLKNARVNTDD